MPLTPPVDEISPKPNQSQSCSWIKLHLFGAKQVPILKLCHNWVGQCMPLLYQEHCKLLKHVPGLVLPILTSNVLNALNTKVNVAGNLKGWSRAMANKSSPMACSKQM
jgi:hypothetical protein